MIKFNMPWLRHHVKRLHDTDEQVNTDSIVFCYDEGQMPRGAEDGIMPIKIWQMKKNTYMHFEEKSIIYISSKFQLDTCMFDSNILLTKFGSGFWFRIPGVGSGFYSFPIFVCDFHKLLYLTDFAVRKVQRSDFQLTFFSDLKKWPGKSSSTPCHILIRDMTKQESEKR